MYVAKLKKYKIKGRKKKILFPFLSSKSLQVCRCLSDEATAIVFYDLCVQKYFRCVITLILTWSSWKSKLYSKPVRVPEKISPSSFFVLVSYTEKSAQWSVTQMKKPMQQLSEAWIGGFACWFFPPTSPSLSSSYHHLLLIPLARRDTAATTTATSWTLFLQLTKKSGSCRASVCL